KLEDKIEELKNEIQDAVAQADAARQINLLGQMMSTAQQINTKRGNLDTLEISIKNYKTTIQTFQRNLISAISGYLVFTIQYNNGQSLVVKIFRAGAPPVIGAFEFDGNGIKINTGSPINVNQIQQGYFHYMSSEIKPLQIPNNYSGSTVFSFTLPPARINNQDAFFFSESTPLINKLNRGDLATFFLHNLKIADKGNGFGSADKTIKAYHELKSPYSLYNWELFFHIPLLLAENLTKSQQFEEAMKWFHYVFNPMAEGNDDKRFWQFFPFMDTDAQKSLEKIFAGLKPNTADEAISAWRNNPFKPHLVARERPVAYMKWMVMKYIDNIVAWGDYLFKQDTIESINQATQLYVLAGHILGKRPQAIARQTKKIPQTYLSLLDKWDAFSNAMSEIETAVVNSNLTGSSVGLTNRQVPTPGVYGNLSSLYFYIPDNLNLLVYCDTVSDRLFKIRHCENIEGVFRKLPLFEPPIDPAMLVKAAVQGLSIASVLNDLNTTMPNYRFYYLLQKALELCGELRSMGGAILSAMEKKDNEAILLIRAKHESGIHNLMMQIKKQQLEEANKSLESLQQNRKSPESRMKYYLQLAGQDLSKVPGADSDFSEIANAIEKPIDESGLKLIKYEKEDMDKAGEAAAWQDKTGKMETLAGILHIIPNLSTDGKPMGVGAGIVFGGNMLGNAAQAVARGMQTHVGNLNFNSSSAAKKGAFKRGLQDRIMQANAAGYEIKQIDKQILTQQIRIQIASQEIANQQKQIENTQEIEDFLKNKYSNEELYSWMKDSMNSLYHQVYSLALDLAKKAEKTYRFERGLTSSDFINAGYWDAGRNGLLAGEQLYAGLKQLEAAYRENRGYDYEITKHVSLKQINPMAILRLKQSGIAGFSLPELLFDLDYPGHYKRRIKSVSVSIPCIAGPYTGLNATLRLLE
ncbi:MAG: hypothetical protein ABIO04_02590, partial [Ferruginibacter sp.]